ncbi:putative quinol monooxygenase [Bradyrhizobium sp. 2TAF24]|uniref:putative quinol monooxygenase n=1 Tax=Bradyrhizobium sp. 2TAF24 TaxID=3233011 RepID=UPI003F93605B
MTRDTQDGFVVTALWEAKPGEEAAIADILARFVPQMRSEPGTLSVTVHRARATPARYFLYEVFRDEAAYAEHQQTPHFKQLIVEQALPRLATRERTQYEVL